MSVPTIKTLGELKKSNYKFLTIKDELRENQYGMVYHTFDLSKCANGIYFLQVQSEKNIFSKMFVKQQ